MKAVEMEFSLSKAIEFYFPKQTDPCQHNWHLESDS